MAESVAVINARPGRNLAAQFPHSFIWKTCLREIAILDSRQIRPGDLQPGDQLFTREESYQFLLEVICGLHSPVLGETEVMGQFKNFAQKAQESPGWRCTAPWIQRLIADAKKVRTNHLTGLGGRSYGQLAHSHLAGCSRVVVLGSGHLAEEILPWFSGQETHVFCRRPEASSETLRPRHPAAVIHPLHDSLAGVEGATGLVIAAPMSSGEIAAWVERLGCPIEVIVDLRGESTTDPVAELAPVVIHFRQVLEELENNCRFANARVERARDEIRGRAQEFWDRYEIRPFGWEDLCA